MHWRWSFLKNNTMLQQPILLLTAGKWLTDCGISPSLHIEYKYQKQVPETQSHYVFVPLPAYALWSVFPVTWWFELFFFFLLRDRLVTPFVKLKDSLSLKLSCRLRIWPDQKLMSCKKKMNLNISHTKIIIFVMTEKMQSCYN